MARGVSGNIVALRDGNRGGRRAEMTRGEKKERQRGRERFGRERERRSSFVGSCSRGTSRSWRTKRRPPPYVDGVSCSALALSSLFLSRGGAPCDAFGAPCLVIRVIYAALIAPRRTITAAVCVRRLSRLIRRDATLLPTSFRFPQCSGTVSVQRSRVPLVLACSSEVPVVLGSCQIPQGVA